MQHDGKREIYLPYWASTKSSPVGFFCCNGVADSNISVRIIAVYKGLINAFGYVHKTYGLNPFDVQRYENQGEYGVWLDKRTDGKFSLRLQPRGMAYSPVLCVFGVEEKKKIIGAGLLAISINPNKPLKPLEDDEFFALAESERIFMAPPARKDFIIRSMYV